MAVLLLEFVVEEDDVRRGGWLCGERAVFCRGSVCLGAFFCRERERSVSRFLPNNRIRTNQIIGGNQIVGKKKNAGPGLWLVGTGRRLPLFFSRRGWPAPASPLVQRSSVWCSAPPLDQQLSLQASHRPALSVCRSSARRPQFVPSHLSQHPSCPSSSSPSGRPPVGQLRSASVVLLAPIIAPSVCPLSFVQARSEGGLGTRVPSCSVSRAPVVRERVFSRSPCAPSESDFSRAFRPLRGSRLSNPTCQSRRGSPVSSDTVAMLLSLPFHSGPGAVSSQQSDSQFFLKKTHGGIGKKKKKHRGICGGPDDEMRESIHQYPGNVVNPSISWECRGLGLIQFEDFLTTARPCPTHHPCLRSP